jgi:hypothetical protein
LSRKLYENFKNATLYIITLFITEIIKILSKKYPKAQKIRLNGILSFYYLYQSNGSKYNKITVVHNYLKLNFLKVFKLLDLNLIIYYRLIAKNIYILWLKYKYSNILYLINTYFDIIWSNYLSVNFFLLLNLK